MHPSVIAGAMPAPLIGEPLGGCRLQSLPCKGRCRRRRRRGAAPCHAFTFTGQQCPHRPANLSAVAMLSGGRNRPPGKASGGRDEKHLSAARPVFLAPVPGLGTCSRQIVGRAFTPAAKASGCRGVSGPMLGIVPQSCRSPQCLGAHSFFPLLSVYRQVARRAKSPALQSKANGRRNRKLCLCGRRFFPRHPFAGDCRAGVHARRESFRPPPCIRAREAHGPSKFRTPHSQFQPVSREDIIRDV